MFIEMNYAKNFPDNFPILTNNASLQISCLIFLRMFRQVHIFIVFCFGKAIRKKIKNGTYSNLNQ